MTTQKKFLLIWEFNKEQKLLVKTKIFLKKQIFFIDQKINDDRTNGRFV